MNLSISPIDVAIIAVYLVATVLFGLWVGRRARGLDDYLLGGRDLPWWAVLGSIVATETSTVTFLSIPGILWLPTGDFRFLQLTFGFIIGRFIVTLIFLPYFFRGRTFSAYDFLRTRFGRATSQNASILFIVTRTLSDGMRLFLTAIVLEKVLGIGLPYSIGIIGVSTIVYTFFGGMKSVVWNDCIQLVIYLIGGLVAGIVLMNQLGWTTIVEYGQANGKLQLFDLRISITEPYTLLGGIVGGMFLTLATHGSDQLMVQRYLCAKNRTHAGIALMLSGFVVMVQFALFLAIGLGLACFYSQPEHVQQFAKRDEVFATFIVEELPVGLVGLVLAAVFCAAMSTLSSSLNSSATSMVNDLLRRDRRPISADERAASEPRWTRLSRLCTLLFGVLQISVALVTDRIFSSAETQQSVIDGVLSIAGFVTGIILGVFFLALVSQWVDEMSAIHGMLIGIMVMSFVAFGTDLAWTWYALAGSFITFTVGWCRWLLLGREKPPPTAPPTSQPPNAEPPPPHRWR